MLSVMPWEQFYRHPTGGPAGPALLDGSAPQRVYDLLEQRGPLTSQEIAYYCSLAGPDMRRQQAACATNRLKRHGLVEMAEQRLCTVSGRLRVTWRAVDA